MIRLPENRGITRTAGIKSLTTHLRKWIRVLCPNLGCRSNPWI